MTEQDVRVISEEDASKRALDKRLDAIGWGLFLVMIGGLWLVPEGIIPEGTWLIGAGLIVLGLSAVRYLTGLNVSWFWVVLGVLALGSGLGAVFGLSLPVFPILLIIAGAATISGVFFDRGQR